MNRIDRLFGITTLLQAKKYVLAEQLAEQFGISVRTVYRDIKALGEQGIPVSFEPHKGYFLVQGYFLPPVSFTPEEANAMVLLETIAGTLADASIQAQYTAALTKVKAALRERERDRLEQFTSRIKMHLPEYFRGPADYLATLQSALADRRVIEMEYCDKSGQSSRRPVEPIGLAFYNLAWHLIGWCQLREDYRDFKVARIRQLTATTRLFTKTDHLLLTEYIAGLNLPYVP
ncbi:helix-turn-helix transcriptional regulator [Hymenobacter cellulosilyticus]|uniref:YafY family transcriptional regulator n=1 Tax=Hymenobacter cellulosilyticus TaxID=2932248 RepID=A0A8T9Q4X3_9BACT|nr:YafY family protein [Hymenobacter cellulosilyticus]UOQ70529.1 YafY family transcriptional regulator [Hymenobacter cellulosilyticus]